MIRSHGVLELRFLPWLPYFGVVFGVSLLMVLLANVLHRMTAGSVTMDAGLYGVTGRMGRGKSYFLALAASWAFRRSRSVFANFELAGASLLTSWSEIVSVPDRSLVLIDEVQLWWASGDHAAPIEVREWVTQLRKKKITCLWASQDVSFVARWLRLLSFGIWECRRLGRGHRYTLVDPSQAGRSPSQQKSLARFHVRRKRRVMALYDTLGLVSSSREWGSGEVPLSSSVPVVGSVSVEDFYRPAG